MSINRDILDIDKLNKLPQPMMAILMGGSECLIESIEVETGLMRLDINGMIDIAEFVMVRDLVDANGGKHDPDDFWISGK